jgi:hypothetical protein
MDIGLHGELHVNPREAFANSKQYAASASITRLDAKVILPILYNFAADFLALIFTRRVLKYLSRRATNNVLMLSAVVIVTSCLLLVLSFVFLECALTIINYMIRVTSRAPIGPPPQGWENTPVGTFAQALLFPVYKRYGSVWSIGTFNGVFVWSTLTGIIWVMIFSTSVIVANASMKLRGVGPWLNRNFHVQRQPFRILAVLTIIPAFTFCVIYHAWL